MPVEDVVAGKCQESHRSIESPAPAGDSFQDFVFLRVLPAQETHNDKYCPIDEKKGISKDFPGSYRPKKCEKDVAGPNDKYPEKNVLGPSFAAQATSGEIAE